MTTKKYLALFGLLCVVGGLIYVGSSINRRFSLGEHIRLAIGMSQYIRETNQRTFRLQGKVIDDKGAELRDVKLTIERHYVKLLDGDGSSARHQSDDHIVGPQFDTKDLQAAGMTFTFSKEGYRETTFSVNTESESHIAAVLAPFGGTGKARKWEGAVIELQKYGQLTTLEKALLTIDFTAAGQGKVSITKEGNPPDAFLEQLSKLLRVTAKVENGGLVTIPGGPKTIYPVELSIEIGHQDWGLIKQVSPSREHYIRHVRHAPETGYVQTITFKGEEIRSAVREGNTVCGAFAKFGSKYGRIKVGAFVDPETEKGECRIGVEIQPDGTRNLETEK